MSALAVAGLVHSVRTAVVNGLLDDRLDLAAKVWPGHPRVKLAIAMASIGTAAAGGRSPDSQSLSLAQAALRRAPLAVEPFLISGAFAQSEGNQRRAEALFVEASRRDPRSTAARFFLAQRFLSTGRLGEGLKNALVLVRLVSGGSEALAPALAQYAKSPEAVPALRSMFAVDPSVRDLVLTQLSNDKDNYATIMSLAGSDLNRVSTEAVPGWQLQLLRKLIEGGELARARSLWLRISGLSSDPTGIFNPGFRDLHAPAPFNWTLSTGEYGVAEPIGNEGLRVIYSGLSTAVIANQTMLLAPGNYRLIMQVTRDAKSDAQSGLSWSITCARDDKSLLDLSISTQPGRRQGISGRFTVPATCAAQSIKLNAVPIQFGSSEEVAINHLQLVSDVR